MKFQYAFLVLVMLISNQAFSQEPPSDSRDSTTPAKSELGEIGEKQRTSIRKLFWENKIDTAIDQINRQLESLKNPNNKIIKDVSVKLSQGLLFRYSNSDLLAPSTKLFIESEKPYLADSSSRNSSEPSEQSENLNDTPSETSTATKSDLSEGNNPASTDTNNKKSGNPEISADSLFNFAKNAFNSVSSSVKAVATAISSALEISPYSRIYLPRDHEISYLNFSLIVNHLLSNDLELAGVEARRVAQIETYIKSKRESEIECFAK